MRAGHGPLPPFDELPELPRSARERVIMRLEAAWSEGLLRIGPEQFADVLMCLLPEDFVVSLPTGGASLDPVGSVGRLATYRDRSARRETITGSVDADAVRNDRLEVRVKNRSSGRGVKSAGYHRPTPKPAQAGMYRDAAGKWFELM